MFWLTNYVCMHSISFLPARRYASAVLAVIVCLYVCLSVRHNSQVGVLVRRLNLKSRKQRRAIAQGF